MNEPTHHDLIKRLEKWDWPSSRVIPLTRQRTLLAVGRWAAAALLIAAAFFAGRRSSPPPDLAGWRSDQARHTTAEISRLADSLEQARRDDRQVILGLLQKMQNQHAADFLTLRRDLETVAATAEDRLERTHHNLLLLTSQKTTALDH